MNPWLHHDDIVVWKCFTNNRIFVRAIHHSYVFLNVSFNKLFKDSRGLILHQWNHCNDANNMYICGLFAHETYNKPWSMKTPTPKLVNWINTSKSNVHLNATKHIRNIWWEWNFWTMNRLSANIITLHLNEIENTIAEWQFQTGVV